MRYSLCLGQPVVLCSPNVVCGGLIVVGGQLVDGMLQISRRIVCGIVVQIARDVCPERVVLVEAQVYVYVCKLSVWSC